MLNTIGYSKEEIQRLPLRLCLLGFHHRQETVRRPNGVDVNLWFLCTEGKGEVTINGKTSVIGPGQSFLIFVGVPHSYRPLDDHWTLQILGFSGALLPYLTGNITESGIYTLQDNNRYIECVNTIHDLLSPCLLESGKLSKRAKLPKIELSVALYRFLLYTAGHVNRLPDFTSENPSDLTEQISSYLEKHFAEDFSLDDMAADLHRTKQHLCNVFKKDMNRTIIELLCSIRIVHARDYLVKYPEKKISEIAQLCGFRSASYFGLKFKEYNEVTPEEYRHNMLRGY